MTVEELMEVLQRCDKYKPVAMVVCGIGCEIEDVRASSPSSASNPMLLITESETLAAQIAELNEA